MAHDRNIQNPAIVAFSGSDERKITEHQGRLIVPQGASWRQFQNEFDKHIEGHDSVMVSLNDDVDRDDGQSINNINIKTKHINKSANQADIPVMAKQGESWYMLNPSYEDKFQDYQQPYAPTDDEVMERYESYESKENWQEHQSEVFDRMATVYPLANANYPGQPDHKGDLTQPKRGLSEEDLEGYWSWKANDTINPQLYDDDFVGIPGIEAYSRSDFTMTPQKGPNAGETQQMDVKVLQTANPSGLMIPMANKHGNTAKYQIATDNSAFNIRLKPRVEDGTSIQHSEIYDKKKREYNFKMDGEDSKLRVDDVKLGKGKDVITFSDAKGSFQAELGEDMKETLTERGYEIPDIIDTMESSQNAKYMWQGPGKMTGSKEVQKTVTPSDAGFTVAREPENGRDDYLMVVTEGALKGKIVSKYLNEPDEQGESVGDHLGAHNGRGLIVAQVPGVSKAFIESVPEIHDEYNISGTYIAMDADGRDNLSVAKGIHQSEEILKEHSPVKIMSWNPEHKGLDDALIAVGRHEITREDMDIRFGSPEKLFPLDEAKSPNPYKLDGSRANKQQWMQEYSESVKKSDAKIADAQQNAQPSEQDAQTEQQAEAQPSAGQQEQPVQHDVEARAREMEEASKDFSDDIEALNELDKSKDHSL